MKASRSVLFCGRCLRSTARPVACDRDGALTTFAGGYRERVSGSAPRRRRGV